MESRLRLSSIGKTPALDIPDSELTRDKSSFSLSSESEDVRPPLYISGVSISRTPEPAAGKIKYKFLFCRSVTNCILFMNCLLSKNQEI